ncbi:hypothetical protein ACTMTF_05210 [Nonomuraea sp. ZG12]|uniref:hypothetical protein n=1 Tax=Nonomuraea sp. ZG12 TaxID=3452207 RepID=UPI003F8BC223
MSAATSAPTRSLPVKVTAATRLSSMMSDAVAPSTTACRTPARAGDRQVTGIASARRSADPVTCLSPGLAATARPLVVDLLGRFGLSGSRRIDPAGVIQRGHFTGYDGSIHAWADAIGVPSAP